MSLPYQIEETLPEGGLLEGGRRKGEEIHNNMHFHRRAHARRRTQTQMHRGRRGAVVSWQTNDRQMTCWNTSTGLDSNRPVRLCQWHLLWREKGERARPACHFTRAQPLPNPRMRLLPPLSTVSNLICLSIWVTGSEDVVKGGMMERWNSKEEEGKVDLLYPADDIWYLSGGSVIYCGLHVKLMLFPPHPLNAKHMSLDYWLVFRGARFIQKVHFE